MSHRRFAPLILSALLLFLGVLSPSGAAAQSLAGDANGDGQVTTDDLIYLADAIFDPVAFPPAAGADANGDGLITSADLIWTVLAQPPHPPPPTSTPRPATPTRTVTPTPTETATPSATPTPTACSVQSISSGINFGSLGPGDCTNHDSDGRFGDVYSVTAAPGQALRIQVTSGDFTPRIVVRDAGGYFSTAIGNSSAIELLVTTTRPYEFLVSSKGPGSATGSYTLTVSVRPCPTPRPLTPTESGVSLSGSIQESDCPDPAAPNTPADRYTFTAQAGTAISVLMKVTSPTSNVDPYITVYGPTLPGAFTGISLGSDDDSGGGLNDNDARLSFYALASGTYTVVASAGSSTGAYTLVVSLPDCPASPAAVSTEVHSISGTLGIASCPAPLPLPDAAKGEVNSAADVWTVSAEAGDVIAAQMLSDDFDAQLYLLGPDMRLLASDDDDSETDGSDAQLAFTVPQAGTYTIVAASNEAFIVSDPGATGSYTLKVQKCPASALSLDTPTAGSLVSGDCHGSHGILIDSYKFTGSAGQFVTVTMVTDASSDIDAVLSLTDADGNQVSNDDDPFLDGTSTNARVSRVLPQAGTYFVTATSFPDNGAATGGYALWVQSCRTIAAGSGTVSGEFRDDDCELAPSDDGTPGAKLNIFMIPIGANRTLSVLPPGGAGCALAVTPDSLQGPGAESCFSDYFAMPLVRSGTTAVMISAADGTVRDTYTIELRSCPTSPIGFGDTTVGWITNNSCRDASGTLGDFYEFQAPASLVNFNSGATGVIATTFNGGSILMDDSGLTEVFGGIGETASEFFVLGSDLGFGLEIRSRDPNARGMYSITMDLARFNRP